MCLDGAGHGPVLVQLPGGVQHGPETDVDDDDELEANTKRNNPMIKQQAG